jgi:carbamoyltransferase
MIICGIKLTHDGGIAVIDNGVLKCSIEMEKINNNPRYSDIKDTTVIQDVLESCGYSLEQIDRFVIDGWHGTGQFWDGDPAIKIMNGGDQMSLNVAPYNERTRQENILARYDFGNKLCIGNKKYNYSSYMHVTGHVISAYSSSPFSKKGESAYVLVWDGGQYPRLYYFDARTNAIKNLGHLFLILGTIYSIFAQYFGPYKKTETELKEDRVKKEIEGYFGGYSVAGKIMSYIALGTVKPELFELFDRIRDEQKEVSNELEHIFSERARRLISPELYSDEDVLATLHVYLENLLLEKLAEKINRYPSLERNLCFSGGCALNIKWNSAIRNSGLFKDVYVPPFPNDSGSAFGAAAAEYITVSNRNSVDWSVYSGPAVKTGSITNGWERSECTVQQLAAILWKTNEPVVFLNGAAELGPRALGNRSILASPQNAKMKDLLNMVKKREYYRPVAPICLEEDAPGIFDPGCKDPFMLFDHKVRTEWKDTIPAICHLDGTARLQTVNKDDNHIVYTLLQEFKKLTGIPLLCNTSANFNGSGFFPDVESAINWGKLNYVWSDNVLYSKQHKIDFSSFLTINVYTEV